MPSRHSSGSSRRQRGAAGLLMVLLTALGLMALTAYSLQAPAAAQKVQYTEHVATQAELKAWSGVALLSEAVKKLPSTPTLTENSAVTLSGVQDGIAITYINTVSGNLVFQVKGSSAGATSTLAVAVRPGAGSSGSSTSSGSFGGGQLLNGPTEFSGDVTYTGTDNTPANITVIGGTLTMSGSVSGLKTVCATGDISMTSAITVETLCSNGKITLGGAANAQSINATGDVTLSGGATSAVGDILSNGAVLLSGGSAAAGTVKAAGNVGVTGGNARATNIFTQGDVNWTSSAVAASINANGKVTYKGSGTTSSTAITAIGDVTVDMAGTVLTQGNVKLNGYWGQGIQTLLKAQKQLSWSTNGNVVGSGTVYSVAATKPSSINVTVTSPTANPVAISSVSVPTVATVTAASPTVNAYALTSQANLVFNGVDTNGNPMVTVKDINGLTDGEYLIATGSGSKDWLCKTVSGTSCVTPLVRVCHGYSTNNSCFSRAVSSGTVTWSLAGTTALPLVLWFNGNVDVGTGKWVNTFLASGNISTSGSMIMFSPNYVSEAYTCRGEATTVEGVSLPALSSSQLSAGYYGKQLCSGSPAASKAADIANVSVLAGGFINDVFSGGNISLGASSKVYGIILAGQYFKSSGSTTVAGFIFAGKQGSEVGKNQEGASTTVKLNGGSSAYKPGTMPCMANCNTQPALSNNIVWASPI